VKKRSNTKHSMYPRFFFFLYILRFRTLTKTIFPVILARSALLYARACNVEYVEWLEYS
jgi:hypothetical protein